MKQKIAIALALVLLGSRAVWAQDRITGMIIDGAMIGGGGLLIAVPFFTDLTETGDILCYTAGGILAASGITFLIFDILSNEPRTASVMRDNAVLKHVSFNVSPDSIYLGLRFNLDPRAGGAASSAAGPTPAAFLRPYPTPPPPAPHFSRR